MNITRLKHAAFIVEAGGQRIGVDIGDFMTPEVTASLGKLDAMVSSHGHGDHYAAANVTAAAAPLAAPADVIAVAPAGIETQTLRLGETTNVAGFAVTPTIADHGPKLSKPIENYGLVIERDDQRLWYIGDSAVPVTPPPGTFDLVLISIDGTGFVFGAEAAAKFVAAIGHRGPTLAIHDGDGEEPHHAKRFAELAAGVCEVVLLQPGEKLEVAP